MRNLDWLLIGKFNQGLQEPCSFGAEVHATPVQSSCRDWGSRRPHQGHPPRPSWAQLLAGQYREPCFSQRRLAPQSAMLDPQESGWVE